MDVTKSKSESVTISDTKLAEKELRLWHILLANAHFHFDDLDEHKIDIDHLNNYWKFETDEIELRQLIQKFFIKVKYSIVNEKWQNEEGAFSLFTSVLVGDGYCRYSYNSQFKRLIHHPLMLKALEKQQLYFGSLKFTQIELPKSKKVKIKTEYIQPAVVIENTSRLTK